MVSPGMLGLSKSPTSKMSGVLDGMTVTELAHISPGLRSLDEWIEI